MTVWVLRLVGAFATGAIIGLLTLPFPVWVAVVAVTVIVWLPPTDVYRWVQRRRRT